MGDDSRPADFVQAFEDLLGQRPRSLSVQLQINGELRDKGT